MGATTSLHGLRYPMGGDPITLATYFQNLANDVDTQLPVVSTTTPTPKSGIVWFNPTTNLTQIYTGTAWVAVNGSYDFTGFPLAGTYNSAKRPNISAGRVNTTTDVNGLLSVSLPTAVTLLEAQAWPEFNTTASARFLMLRTDLCTASLAVWQALNGSGSAIVSTAGIVFGYRLEWQ